MKPRHTRRSAAAPTLNDVAAAAGVSPMTVSRVINGNSNVREPTRDKVNAAIAALRYVPNKAAQSLASAGRCQIALIYGNPSSAYLSELLLGCLAHTARGNVHLLLERMDDDEDWAEAVRRLSTAGIEGVILPPPYCDMRALVGALRSAGIEVALLASGDPAPGTLALSIDDRAAALEMTRHLLARGHRRIGFIAGNPNQTASARREEGYRAALAEAGITPDPALCVAGDFTYRSGLAAAEHLLSLPQPPSAIFASNDDMAAAAVAAAHRHQREIPRDLSVCGFDDTAMATTISPELTTVRQPIAEMGRAAVELLASALREAVSPAPGSRIFAHVVISRESVAQAHGGQA